MKHTLYLIMFVLCVIPIEDVVCQPSTDFNVLQHYMHDDQIMIRSEMEFIEQRVIAVDPKIFTYVLDTIVSDVGIMKIKDVALTDFYSYFDFSSMDTSQLGARFRFNDTTFYPYFNIKSTSLHRAVSSVNVGDTISASLIIAVGANQPNINSVILLRKVYNTTALPAMNFMLAGYDSGFKEAISSFLFDYAAYYYGHNGQLRDEWVNTSIPSAEWDFIDHHPITKCRTNIDLQISSNTLSLLPINVNIGSTIYQLDNINAAVANQYLSQDLVGHGFDLYPFIDLSGSSGHYMFIGDLTQQRIFYGELGSGAMKSEPYYNPSTGVLGHQFDGLKAIYVTDHMSSSLTALSYDRSDKILRKHTVNALSQSGFDGRWEIFETPETASISKIGYGVHEVNLTGTPAWWQMLILSGRAADTTFVSTHTNINGSTLWNSCHKRYIGYVSDCEATFFKDEPIFSPIKRLSNSPNNASRGLLANEGIGIYHNSNFMVTDNDPDYITQSMDAFVPLKRMTSLLGNGVLYTDIVSVERQYNDNKYLVGDRSTGLIHVFDNYDGKYICSYKAGSEPFDKLVAVRQAHGWQTSGVVYESGFCDLFVLEDWHSSSGMRRFALHPELLEINLDRKGDNEKPYVISFTVTARAHFEIDLVDDQGNEYQIGEEYISDARRVILSFSNLNHYDVRIRVKTADHPSYNFYPVIVRTYTIKPDNSVIISKNAKMDAFPTTESIEIYPHPVKSLMNISYKMKTDEIVDVFVYNILGKCVLKKVGVSATTGSNYGYINAASLQPGTYIINIIGAETYIAKTIIIN